MAYTHDLIVIGAGSAGLTAAGGAAMFGLKVALIEAGEMGGDCLNTGCVPSKALIAASSRAHEARRGKRLGVGIAPPEVEFGAVRAHVRNAIATIAPVDSQERFEGLGVEVIREHARFVDRRTIEMRERRLSAPRIVIATGSRPQVPDIPGLADIPYLTNETVFNLDELPRHLAVLGGGPIGMEMAQAFRRLGSEVTVIQKGKPLPRDDEDAAALVTDALLREGVRIECDAQVERAAWRTGDIVLSLGGGRTVIASHLLVATGRVANVEGYGLDCAGVECSKNGIRVDARRRTTAAGVFAIGDCREGPRFTHVSGYEGSVALLNIVLGWPAKVDWRALPWVTYTDPELAQIGLTEKAARERFGTVEVTRQDFAHNDRAIAEGDTTGFLKMIRHRGKVVGVTIVGAHAGDLLLPWTQTITGKASAFALGSAIIAYPGRAEIAKAAAFATFEPKVFSAWPKRWARLIARMRRWR